MTIGAGRRRLLPLTLLAAAAVLFAVSLWSPGGRPPPDLASLAARAAELARAADRALAASLAGGDATPPSWRDAVEVAQALAGLREGLGGGGLAERVARAIDTYYYASLSVANLSKEFRSVPAGARVLSEALGLLAECRVEAAVSRYLEDREVVMEMLDVLDAAASDAALVEPGDALFLEHRGVLEAYRRDLESAALAAELATRLLELVARNPDLGTGLCRGSPQALAKASSLAGARPGQLVAAATQFSPSLGAKLAKALSGLQQASSTGPRLPQEKGGGAGRREAESDD